MFSSLPLANYSVLPISLGGFGVCRFHYDASNAKKFTDTITIHSVFDQVAKSQSIFNAPEPNFMTSARNYQAIVKGSSGNSKWLPAGLPTYPASCSIYVAYIDTVNSGAVALSTSGATVTFSVSSGVAIFTDDAAHTTTGAITMPANQVNSAIVVCTGGASALYANGVADTTGLATFSAGAMNNIQCNTATCGYLEVAVFFRALSVSEVQNLHSYCVAKWR